MRVKNGMSKMIISWLLYVNFLTFVVKGAYLRMRPMKGITNPYLRTTTRRLCGPQPRPGEDCRPSDCSFIPINADASYEKVQYSVKCVPASPNRITRRPMIRTGDESITSSTSAPLDIGGKTTLKTTPKTTSKTTPETTKPDANTNPVEVKCNGLANCKDVGAKEKDLIRTRTTSNDLSHKESEHDSDENEATKKTTTKNTKKTTKKESEEEHAIEESETTKKTTTKSSSKMTTEKESKEQEIERKSQEEEGAELNYNNSGA